MTRARYDGLASWYDEAFAQYATAEDGPGAELARLLGAGPGFVLAVVGGYRDNVWVREHENFGPGVRRRIGARHVPLAELLDAFGGAGLHVAEVSETGSSLVPWMLNIRSVRG